MDMDVVQLIQNLGFPIACVVACGASIHKLVLRDKDEAKDREDKLIEANKQTSAALDKVANTIEETNNLNRELSETNRTLVDKVDSSLNEINNNVDKILERLTD